MPLVGEDLSERTRKAREDQAELDAAGKRKVEVQDRIEGVLASTALFDVFIKLPRLARLPFVQWKRAEEIPFNVVARPAVMIPFGITINFSEHAPRVLDDGSRIVHTSITRYPPECRILHSRSRTGPEELHYSIRQVYIVPQKDGSQRAETWERYYTVDRQGRPNIYSFELLTYLNEQGNPQIAYLDLGNGFGPIPVTRPDYPRRNQIPFSEQVGISDLIFDNLILTVNEHTKLLEQEAPDHLLEIAGQGRGEAMTVFTTLREVMSLLHEYTVLLESGTEGSTPLLLPGVLRSNLKLADYIADRNTSTFPHVQQFRDRIALIKEYADEAEEYQLYIVEDFRNSKGVVCRIMFVPTRLNASNSEAIHTEEFRRMIALELNVVYREVDGQEFFELHHQVIRDSSSPIDTGSPAYGIVEILCQEMHTLTPWQSVNLTQITQISSWYPIPAEQALHLGADPDDEVLDEHEFQNLRRLVEMYEFVSGNNQQRGGVLQQMAFTLTRLLDRYPNDPETFSEDFPELSEMNIPQPAFDLALQMLISST
ncbi:MAG: hypothetical protein PHS44_06235 [Candidatus Dojkabacteria bacterium]|jgi:hypothetical protein|nr:hypothetical protein [Candidatus Dojkabacteria bacterium]